MNQVTDPGLDRFSDKSQYFSTKILDEFVTVRAQAASDVVRNHREIESDIIARLIRVIGEDRFDLWFESRSAIQYSDQKLTILSTEQFSQQRIRASFLDDLQHIASQAANQSVVVEFQLVPSLPSSEKAANCSTQNNRQPVPNHHLKLVTANSNSDNGQPTTTTASTAASTPAQPATRPRTVSYTHLTLPTILLV